MSWSIGEIAFCTSASQLGPRNSLDIDNFENPLPFNPKQEGVQRKELSMSTEEIYVLPRASMERRYVLNEINPKLIRVTKEGTDIDDND
jgi:hypothetical protein